MDRQPTNQPTNQQTAPPLWHLLPMPAVSTDLQVMMADERATAVYLNYASGITVSSAAVLDAAGRVALIQFTPLGQPDPIIALPVCFMPELARRNVALLVQGVVRLAALGSTAPQSAYNAIVAELRAQLVITLELLDITAEDTVTMLRWWLSFLAMPTQPETRLSGKGGM